MSNVKNAPEGKYFAEIGYSQTYPWILISVSASGKTAKIQKVRTKSDPEFKPNIIPGGFCGHCDNQHAQTWLFDGLEEYTTTIRKNKKGQWVRGDVNFRETNGPEYFYDWNF